MYLWDGLVPLGQTRPKVYNAGSSACLCRMTNGTCGTQPAKQAIEGAPKQQVSATIHTNNVQVNTQKETRTGRTGEDVHVRGRGRGERERRERREREREREREMERWTCVGEGEGREKRGETFTSYRVRIKMGTYIFGSLSRLTMPSCESRVMSTSSRTASGAPTVTPRCGCSKVRQAGERRLHHHTVLHTHARTCARRYHECATGRHK